MGLARNRNLPPLQQLLLVLLVALLSAGLWYGWFAWDTEYHYDADAGGMTGPYQVWQGVAAFFCGLVVIAIAYRLLHFVVALLVLPASFTLAWISTASAENGSGLWAVGGGGDPGGHRHHCGHRRAARSRGRRRGAGRATAGAGDVGLSTRVTERRLSTPMLRKTCVSADLRPSRGTPADPSPRARSGS